MTSEGSFDPDNFELCDEHQIAFVRGSSCARCESACGTARHLTTEQARELHDSHMRHVPCDDSCGKRCTVKVERDQLRAWVKARVLEEGDPEAYSDPAAHVARVVAADLRITEAQAEALIDEADGWPL